MAKFLRDYKVTFLVEGDKNNKLIYSTIDAKNPLHVTFSTSYDVAKPTSKLELNIYNMSPASKKLLQAPDVKVLLEVGVRDTTKEGVALNTLFLGTVSEPIQTNSSSSDHVTRIKATSGYEIKQLQLSNSLDSPKSKLQVIQSICSDIQRKSGGMVTFDLSYLLTGGYNNSTRDEMFRTLEEVYPDGFSYQGTADTCLRDVLRDLNLEYSMKKGGVIRIHKQNHTEGQLAFTFSKDNGLLSTPQPVSVKSGQSGGDPRRSEGYTFKSLLVPQINVNDRIRIKDSNLDIKDDLIVQNVKFSGGYEASHWFSNIKANFDTSEDPNKNIAEYKISSKQDINYYKLLTGE